MKNEPPAQRLAFSPRAYAKMIMHSMKYAHSDCGGFLLSRKEDSDSDTGNQLSINDAIPVSHACRGLAPNLEIAFNSVKMYADLAGLMISGYYHTDKNEESNSPDVFSQKTTEKLFHEHKIKPVLCFIKFDDLSRDETDSFLVQYQYIDGKWTKNTSGEVIIEYGKKQILDKLIFTKEKLYRDIADFDDHLDDISLDWLNTKISQKIDHIIGDES